MLDIIIEEGWKTTNSTYGNSDIYQKGDLRLWYNPTYDEVVWMYDISSKKFEYTGKIPEGFRYRGKR